jgi:hypothetical protein
MRIRKEGLRLQLITIIRLANVFPALILFCISVIASVKHIIGEEI